MMSVLCKLTILYKPNPLFSTITQLKLFFIVFKCSIEGGGSLSFVNGLPTTFGKKEDFLGKKE